jgi:hypothetical protein
MSPLVGIPTLTHGARRGCGPGTWVTLWPSNMGCIWDALSIGIPTLTRGVGRVATVAD